MKSMSITMEGFLSLLRSEGNRHRGISIGEGHSPSVSEFVHNAKTEV